MIQVATNISKTICCLSALNCEGCERCYASFSDHTCFSTPWNTQVLFYYQQALQELQSEYLDSSELYDHVLKYGPSYN